MKIMTFILFCFFSFHIHASCSWTASLSIILEGFREFSFRILRATSATTSTSNSNFLTVELSTFNYLFFQHC